MIPEMNKFHNIDCKEYMKTVPDKFFELAIVDPPYGINRSKNFGLKKYGWKQYDRKNWDTFIPGKLYFNELFRISGNQIIWGGNYFVKYLKPSMGWILWDKGQRNFSTSDGELAYTSFQNKLKIYELSRAKSFINNGKNPIHPTQKPVALYRWLLQNYAKPNDKIFDSHVGSGSSIIACIEEKHDYVGCELDKDYYKAASERIRIFKEQLRLF